MSLQHYSFVSIVFDVDLPLMLPVIYLSLATMAILMYGVVISTDNQRHAPVLQQSATVLALWVLSLTLYLVLNMPDLEATVLYHTLSIDDLSTTLQAGIIIATSISLWSGLGYCIRTRLNAYEYVVLVLLATQGMMLLVSSQDLVGLYLAIELQSLCFYVLAAYARHSEFAVEAGLKYFVLGAFSSGLLLFGASLMYGAT